MLLYGGVASPCIAGVVLFSRPKGIEKMLRGGK
jgi:hypothetical protein